MLMYEMFIIVLLTTDKKWKESNGKEWWGNEAMCYSHTMEY
jgi:hypothetical protein